MEKYLVNGKNKFEIVDEIPLGYSIWKIGKNMVDGYLPLCRVKPNSYDIEVETLKAIKCKDAQVILAAIGGGQDTAKKMSTYIKRYSSSTKSGTLVRVERIKKALEVLKTVKGYQYLK